MSQDLPIAPDNGWHVLTPAQQRVMKLLIEDCAKDGGSFDEILFRSRTIASTARVLANLGCIAVRDGRVSVTAFGQRCYNITTEMPPKRKTARDEMIERQARGRRDDG